MNVIASVDRHRVPAEQFQANGLFYKKTYAWVIEGARWLDEPLAYTHPSGAVIWVDLSKAMPPAGQQRLAAALDAIDR